MYLVFNYYSLVVKSLSVLDRCRTKNDQAVLNFMISLIGSKLSGTDLYLIISLKEYSSSLLYKGHSIAKLQVHYYDKSLNSILEFDIRYGTSIGKCRLYGR